MKAIVCADINWGIGKGTGMLFHIPADLKFFKEKTMGSTVIMGRTTLASPCRGRRLCLAGRI